MNFNFNKKTPYDAAQQVEEARQMLRNIIPVRERAYRNRASLFVSDTMSIIEEGLYYILALACLVFIFIMKTIFPFHLLGELNDRPVFREHIANASDISSFNLAVKGLVVLIALLLFFLGIKKNRMRQQKKALAEVASSLKLVEDHFRAKEEELNALMERDAKEAGKSL